MKINSIHDYSRVMRDLGMLISHGTHDFNVPFADKLDLTNKNLLHFCYTPTEQLNAIFWERCGEDVSSILSSVVERIFLKINATFSAFNLDTSEDVERKFSCLSDYENELTITLPQFSHLCGVMVGLEKLKDSLFLDKNICDLTPKKLEDFVRDVSKFAETVSFLKAAEVSAHLDANSILAQKTTRSRISRVSIIEALKGSFSTKGIRRLWVPLVSSIASLGIVLMTPIDEYFHRIGFEKSFSYPATAIIIYFIVFYILNRRVYRAAWFACLSVILTSIALSNFNLTYLYYRTINYFYPTFVLDEKIIDIKQAISLPELGILLVITCIFVYCDIKHHKDD